MKEIRNKIIKEWHPTKNGELTPDNASYKSNEKIWWLCKEGHEWTDTIANRVMGKGCSQCSKSRVSEENCLDALNPKLARSWHPTKNKKLVPKNITASSDEIVWWQCDKGHEWKTSVNNRNQGSDCPFCNVKKASEENCLAILSPKLSKEWHPTKNRDLTPNDVSCNCCQKVWWKCKKGHEWKDVVFHRVDGEACPYC